MIKSRSRFSWWLRYVIIKYVIIISIVSVFWYLDLFYLFLILIGLIATIFNKQLYNWMVRYSFWMSKRIGGKEIAKATRTTLYRRFYRISIFVMGLVLIYLGISMSGLF